MSYIDTMRIGYHASFIVTWINLFTLVLSLGVFSLGIYLSTQHRDCEKFLTTPVFVIGAFTFTISIIGFIGAWKDITCLLWIYLFLLLILLALIATFTVFAFVVTNKGAGHAVGGQGFKEYKLGDYSNWLQKRISNDENWNHLRSCLVRTKYCNKLAWAYPTVQQFKQAHLNPIQSGCCRPPSECGYQIKNSTFYYLTSRVHSNNKDCKVYKNDQATKCYSCNSCKAGVAQYLKEKWRAVAIFNLVLLVVLVVIYSFGCCARRNASDVAYTKFYG